MLSRTSSLCLLAVASVAVFAAPAGAVLSIATDSQTNGTDSFPNPYTVSSTDLINGLSATNVTGTFTQEGAGGTPVLTDGTMPATITRQTTTGTPPNQVTTGSPFQFSSFATGGTGNTPGGLSATYTLVSPANLTSILTYGGWQDNGRDQQSYSVLYATAADPTTFLPLATVNFNPSGGSDPGGHPDLTRVTLTDSSGILASNVKALRFDFNATENGYAGYAEIDVNGTVVPEPASLSILALGGIGLLARRRRA